VVAHGRVVRPGGHGRSGTEPVGGVRHLATRGQVTVSHGRVVHVGRGRGGAGQTIEVGLVQVRVVHDDAARYHVPLSHRAARTCVPTTIQRRTLYIIYDTVDDATAALARQLLHSRCVRKKFAGRYTGQVYYNVVVIRYSILLLLMLLVEYVWPARAKSSEEDVNGKRGEAMAKSKNWPVRKIV